MTEKERILKQAKDYRLKHEKYRYYVPTGKGEEFLNAVGSGKYFVSLFSAANGIGKTMLAVNLLAHLIWGCNSKWFQQPIFKKWDYPKKIRIVSDPTTLIDTIIPTMEDQFPRGRFGHDKYTVTKEGKRYDSKWRTDTGWEISLMSYEQSVKEFESATLGLVWFDEPPPKPIYKACVARLRTGGMMFITATPLTGSAWMYDEILANPDNEKGFRTYVEADVESACKTHGIRGFLEHDHIEKMILQYDETDLQARVFGKFQHLIGLVFKNFNRNIHVVEPFEVNKKDFVVIEALDNHPRNPDAVMWVAINRQNTKYVIREMYQKFDDVTELAERIKGKSSDLRIAKRIIDPSAFVQDQHKTGQLSLAQELDNLGLGYEKGSKARTEAIKRTRGALSFQEEDGRIYVPPELYVCSNCMRTIYEFEHWQWDEWRGKHTMERNPREVPQDKDDHMMENLGRILLENMSFYEMDKYVLEDRTKRDETVLDPFD